MQAVITPRRRRLYCGACLRFLDQSQEILTDMVLSCLIAMPPIWSFILRCSVSGHDTARGAGARTRCGREPEADDG